MKKAANLLDLVPVPDGRLRTEADENGNATVFVENRGAFNFVMQKIFGKPRFTQIHLDEFGSFVWKNIDGKTTVGEIARKLSEEFGDKVEPLHARLASYMKTLEQCAFITIRHHD